MSARDTRLDALRAVFVRFGETEAVAQRSPIYERRSAKIAGVESLLALAAEAAPGQPLPNLFFAAVHAALADHPTHALAAYYPSVGGSRAPVAGLTAAFRDFVAEHRAVIAATLRERLVQTNEVRRSAALLPAFRTVSDEAGGASLALMEIGASAGLNLLFDRFGYRYGVVTAGDPRSPVQLAVELRGGVPPVEPVPLVVSRAGIDLRALDVRDEADRRWLRALSWPEHDERRRVLEAAFAVASARPPAVVSGDVFAWLPRAIRAAPADAAVTVVTTFVLNQLTAETHARLRSVVLEASHARPLWCVVLRPAGWIDAPPDPPDAVRIWRMHVHNGVGRARPPGLADAHGWWISWAPGEERAW